MWFLSFPIANLIRSEAMSPPKFKTTIKLQRAFGPPNDPRPALFAYKSEKGKGVQYSVNAEFRYGQEPNNRDEVAGWSDWRYTLGAAVHLTQDSTAEDAISTSFMMDRIDKGEGESLRQRKYYRSYSASFETDREGASQKYLAQGRWTVVDPNYHLHSFGTGNSGPLMIGLYPYVGIDLGDVVKKGASPEEAGLLERFMEDVTLKIELHDLNLVVYGESVGYYLPRQNGRKDFHLWIAGADLKLSDHASLVFEYKVGDNAPEFKHIDGYTVSLGVKF